MRSITLTLAAGTLGLAQAGFAAAPTPTREAAARDALLASLSLLKRDNLYLSELAAYQAQLIVSARADPVSVRETGRRPLAACLATRLKPLCPLFHNTFAASE